ncbi:hypothetical protein [Rhizobium herbae]
MNIDQPLIHGGRNEWNLRRRCSSLASFSPPNVLRAMPRSRSQWEIMQPVRSYSQTKASKTAAAAFSATTEMARGSAKAKWRFGETSLKKDDIGPAAICS